MKIGFIFVLYNTSPAEQKRLTKEVSNLKFAEYELYFIDNSTNGCGFAAGVNQGLTLAKKDECDIYFIANPDISLAGITGTQLLTASEDFDIWGFAMKQQESTYYCGIIDVWRLSGSLSKTKPVIQFMRCDYVTGSLMAIKKEVIEKVGEWDESYFMYYEDVDYCTRAKNAGFRVGIDTTVTYMHYEVSTKNPQKDELIRKARLRYFMRYANGLQRLRELIRLPKTWYEK